jgi:hypothetical protein
LNFYKWDYIINKEQVTAELEGVAEANCGAADADDVAVSTDWMCIYTAERAIDVRCGFSDDIMWHPRMSLDPTPYRLKRVCV